MNRVFALVTSLVIAATATAEDRRCPTTMQPSVEAKLHPVLSALAKANDRKDIWDKQLEIEFNRLLSAKDSASRQARVALMDYYVGEAYGEALVCAVALDGDKMAELLRLYDECDIQPAKSPVPRDHASGHRIDAMDLIRNRTAKKNCTYE